MAKQERVITEFELFSFSISYTKKIQDLSYGLIKTTIASSCLLIPLNTDLKSIACMFDKRRGRLSKTQY